MYTEDSFFTLTIPGQIGLALLSLVLACSLLLALRQARRWLPVAATLLVAVIAFWAFEWLSPQIYYFYYMTQFDGLPFQSVVHTPPSPVKIIQIMTFQDGHNLSVHGRALLGWALIVAALWSGKKTKAPAG